MLMYWSRAPVYGEVPMRSVRAYSVTLVDDVAWLFGGCDEKGSSTASTPVRNNPIKHPPFLTHSQQKQCNGVIQMH
jgi:hypothetical protein